MWEKTPKRQLSNWFSDFITIIKYVEGANIVVCFEPCLRLVEDSDGLRLSLRGVQGVAAGVANKVLVITQEDDAGTGFRLENKQEQRNDEKKKLAANLNINVLELRLHAQLNQAVLKIHFLI